MISIQGKTHSLGIQESVAYHLSWQTNKWWLKETNGNGNRQTGNRWEGIQESRKQNEYINDE